MAPKHGGGATIRGKQAAVHEGPFLQFLRSVGYRDELPPSTVAWLDSAPVFRFLASKLTRDNFITLEEEQEYNELMLARGPDASLYDAVEGYGSDVEDSSSIATSTRGQKESDPFLADLSDDEVARLLEVGLGCCSGCVSMIVSARSAGCAGRMFLAITIDHVQGAVLCGTANCRHPPHNVPDLSSQYRPDSATKILPNPATMTHNAQHCST